MKTVLALILTLCFAVSGVHAALFRSEGKVNDLKTRGDLTSLLTASGGPHLVFIYDSLDVNCHKKASAVAATGEALEGVVPVVAMDVRQPAFQWVLNAWGVQVIPSVGLLHGSPSPPTSPNAAAASKLVSSHLSPYVGGGARHMELFPHTKPITVESLKKSALAALPDKGIVRVSSAPALEKVIRSVTLSKPNREQAVVVLFTDKPKTSALFKSLSVSYNGIVRFVEVVVKGASSPVSKHDVFGGADISTYPALFVLHPSQDGNLTSTRYPADGALSAGEISKFIDDATGITPATHAEEQRMRKTVTENAHRRRSGVVSGVIEVGSKSDWVELVVRNAGITKLNGGPIRIVFSPDVKGLRTSLLGVVASSAPTTPKRIFLVDAVAQNAILKFFSTGSTTGGDTVIDIVPSTESESVVYKFGVHASSLGSEAYLEKPALKRQLEVLNWSEVPDYQE
jgi:hypothetical protein